MLNLMSNLIITTGHFVDCKEHSKQMKQNKKYVIHVVNMTKSFIQKYRTYVHNIEFINYESS